MQEKNQQQEGGPDLSTPEGRHAALLEQLAFERRVHELGQAAATATDQENESASS
jgi:hypothetical protein